MKWQFFLILVVFVLWAGLLTMPSLKDFATRGKRLTRSVADADGIVQTPPAELARLAGETIGRGVELAAYALARMIRSEAGSRSVEERAAIGWVAVNDSEELGWTLTKTLTYHKTDARDGKFGIQRSGRYATTSDPYEGDLRLAEAIIARDVPDPTGGAVKFLHKSAFGVQEGTRSYDEVAAEWRADGLEPGSVEWASFDFVVFRRGGGLA